MVVVKWSGGRRDEHRKSKGGRRYLLYHESRVGESRRVTIGINKSREGVLVVKWEENLRLVRIL